MLVPILRAAHCRSTHHFFAIDAIERIGTERGRRLGEMLLKHYAVYLRGAKDPDDKFKDFQNHVLHVSDKQWGGAPKACEEWLAKTQQLLSDGKWSDAAYACGVLSHYFTDPIMPLHTGQSQPETVVHRPMEWSICKAYDEIYAQCQFARASQQLTITSEPGWISRAVVQGATIAHTHYTRLIEIYNLPRGSVDPPRGLTKEARQILSELFDLAVGGWASVLMRLATDLGSPVPDSSLTLATVIAGIDMPRGYVLRKFTDATERAAVQRIFDEYTTTGKVVDNLPAECKVVRQELAKRDKPQPKPPTKPIEPVVETDDGEGSSESSFAAKSMNEPEKTVPAKIEPVDIEPVDIKPASPPTATQLNPSPPKTIAQPIPIPTTLPAAQITDPEPQDAVESNVAASPQEDAQRDHNAAPSTSQSRVTFASPIVDAPSIGPKTAKRFHEINIHTIEDFLSADAEEMATALQTTWIKPELLIDWQDQTQLVCEVPALCGYKAQLLVAIGCRTTEDLADASARHLAQDIEAFASTKEAQRILRSTEPPDEAEVKRWIESAKKVMS